MFTHTAYYVYKKRRRKMCLNRYNIFEESEVTPGPIVYIWPPLEARLQILNRRMTCIWRPQ
jgi:hypothetical protein